MSWLPEPSPAAVVDALRVIAPALAGLPVTIPSPVGQDDPVFQMSSASLGDDFVVKFAWSQAAARFILHQITILETLALEPTVPYLPEVAAAGTSPLILVTRRVRGTSLFEAVDRIDRGDSVTAVPVTPYTTSVDVNVVGTRKPSLREWECLFVFDMAWRSVRLLRVGLTAAGTRGRWRSVG